MYMGLDGKEPLNKTKDLKTKLWAKYVSTKT